MSERHHKDAFRYACYLGILWNSN